MFTTPNGIHAKGNYVKPKDEDERPEELIPYPLLKELIFSGVRFYYESYDHKEAVEELKTNDPKNYMQYKYMGVPDAIKANHIVWRIGKLRAIAFTPDGRMSGFKIGNKYYKSYHTWDFGVKVKPMICKSDDVNDLIGQGLAVEETF